MPTLSPRRVPRAGVRLMSVAGGCAALAFAGCGSDDKPAAAGGDAAAASGSLPKSGEVVFFSQSQENPYITQMKLGAEKEAKKYGWTLKFVENNNSQEQQDQQIQQVLAGGKKPLGIILHPFLAKSARASQQAIKAAGIPLIITNQVPQKGSEQLFDAYAGTSDILSGATAAELLATKAKEKGMELGGGLVFGFPTGYQSHEDRVKGFQDKLAEVATSAKVLRVENSEGFLEEEGYKVASQVVPANKKKINWVYALNDAEAVGVIKALRENGLTPGKDVLVTGGTCMNAGTAKAVVKGDLVGTAVQSPFVEGQLSSITLAQFLKAGKKTKEGETNTDADAPPADAEVPHKWNFMPNPAVDNNAKAYETTGVWGKPAKTLCEYS